MEKLNVKENKQIFKMEEDQLVKQERDKMLDKLDKALTALKGKEILVDIARGLMTYQIYDNFTYDCFANSKKQLVLDLKDEDEKISSIGIKLDDICDLDIDDNLNEDGSLDEEEINGYYVESIVICLTNGLVIRLELQW